MVNTVADQLVLNTQRCFHRNPLVPRKMNAFAEFFCRSCKILLILSNFFGSRDDFFFFKLFQY